MEGSHINDFEYRHVLFFDVDDMPVACTSFYRATADMAITAPRWLRRLLNAIRRLWPGFFTVRIIECGTPVNMNSPGPAVPDETQVEAVIEALHKLLIEEARKDHRIVIVVRDFEPNAERWLDRLRQLGYHVMEGFPNTYLDIRWPTPEAYLAALKSYYRSKLMKHLRRNEARDIRHELLDDFGHLADILHAQWMVVHNQADEFQREVLTPAFYREFPARLPGRAKTILFYRGAALIGHALLLHDGDLLRWMYFGRTEATNDSLYLYVIHKVVETAILLGAKRLELGTTTYPIKQDIGAQMVPLRFVLRSPYWLINPFVGLVHTLLNRTPPIRNRDVFKAS